MAEILHRNDFESLIQERENTRFTNELWLYEQSVKLNESLYNELTKDELTEEISLVTEGSFRQQSAFKILIITAGYMVDVIPMFVTGEGVNALLTCEFKIKYKPGVRDLKEDRKDG